SSRCAAEVAKALAEKPLFDYDFDLKTLDGKTLKLADLKGKVVIVDIWGTWCPPCRAEIPHFVKLYEKYREKGLEIVGIACERTDDDETSKVVEKFAAEHGIKYPLALNEHGKAEKSVKPSFAGYPTTLFIDRDGKLRLKEIGYHPLEALEAYTKALLDAKAADEPK
ncbi:TlpA family protein disulfide reductase, partial [bacterium]|nr:TlpA family protein disulfide reductase [bacterium]